MIRKIILKIINFYWMCKASFNFYIYGSYGVCNVLKNAPYPFIQPILKKYGAQIGKNCRIDTGIIIHRPDKLNPFKNLKIGDNVYIGHSVLFDLTEEITINNNVAIGAFCQFWTHTGDFKENLNDNNDYKETRLPIEIKNKIIIYSGVILNNGVIVNTNSRIGAGSLVLSDIDSNAFYAGVPAKKIKNINIS